MIKPLPKEKTDDRGTNYRLFDEFTLCDKIKGSISGDHSDNEHEEIYLIHGTIEMTIDDKTTTIDTPSYIYIKPQQYRKVFAVTDAQFFVKKWPIS